MRSKQKERSHEVLNLVSQLISAKDLLEAARIPGVNNAGVSSDGKEIVAWVMGENGFDVEVHGDNPKEALEVAVKKWKERQGAKE
jgi:tRNA(Glu) U13 pseudouridine synthase TruD